MRCRRMMFPASIWTNSNERASGFSAFLREFFNPAAQESMPKWAHFCSLEPATLPTSRGTPISSARFVDEKAFPEKRVHFGLYRTTDTRSWLHPECGSRQRRDVSPEDTS